MKELAGYVSDGAKKSHLENLLIMDFQTADHSHSLLGRKFADDLQAAVSADSTVKLIDRGQYIAFVSREALLIPEANNPDAANWIASQISAKSFVIGEYEKSAADIILHIRIYECPAPRNIQNLKATFSRTAEMPSLDLRGLAATGEDALSAEQKAGAALAASRGFSPPECRRCPQPPFSSTAIERKANCTINLIAEIDEEGRISDLQLTRGFFYGLNETVLKGVKEWRMKPAVGPDGKPAKVQQMIEVAFRMGR